MCLFIVLQLQQLTKKIMLKLSTKLLLNCTVRRSSALLNYSRQDLKKQKDYQQRIRQITLEDNFCQSPRLQKLSVRCLGSIFRIFIPHLMVELFYFLQRILHLVSPQGHGEVTCLRYIGR